MTESDAGVLERGVLDGAWCSQRHRLCKMAAPTGRQTDTHAGTKVPCMTTSHKHIEEAKGDSIQLLKTQADKYPGIAKPLCTESFVSYLEVALYWKVL